MSKIIQFHQELGGNGYSYWLTDVLVNEKQRKLILFLESDSDDENKIFPCVCTEELLNLQIKNIEIANYEISVCLKTSTRVFAPSTLNLDSLLKSTDTKSLFHGKQSIKNEPNEKFTLDNGIIKIEEIGSDHEKIIITPDLKEIDISLPEHLKRKLQTELNSPPIHTQQAPIYNNNTDFISTYFNPTFLMNAVINSLLVAGTIMLIISGLLSIGVIAGVSSVYIAAGIGVGVLVSAGLGFFLAKNDHAETNDTSDSLILTS